MNNKQMLDSIPTVDLVRALIKRDCVVANTANGKHDTSLILIVEEPNGEIANICSKRWQELNKEVFINE